MRQRASMALCFATRASIVFSKHPAQISVVYLARPEMRHSSASRGSSGLLKRRRAARSYQLETPEGCVRLRGVHLFSVEASHGIAWAKL